MVLLQFSCGDLEVDPGHAGGRTVWGGPCLNHCSSDMSPDKHTG